MKLPLYFSQQPGPQFPGVQQSHDEPRYMRQVGEQLENLGRIGTRSLQQVMGPLIERERQEKELDILNGASLMDNDFALASQDILSEERQNFKDRDSYRQNVDKRLSRVIQDISSRYPKEYQAHAQRQIMDRMTAIHNEDQQWSDARWLEQKQGEMLTVLDRKTNDILEADSNRDPLAMTKATNEFDAYLLAQKGLAIPVEKFAAFQAKSWHDVDFKRAEADAAKQELGIREDYSHISTVEYQKFQQDQMKSAKQDVEDMWKEEQRERQEKERERAELEKEQALSLSKGLNNMERPANLRDPNIPEVEYKDIGAATNLTAPEQEHYNARLTEILTGTKRVTDPDVKAVLLDKILAGNPDDPKFSRLKDGIYASAKSLSGESEAELIRAFYSRKEKTDDYTNDEWFKRSVGEIKTGFGWISELQGYVDPTLAKLADKAQADLMLYCRQNPQAKGPAILKKARELMVPGATAVGEKIAGVGRKADQALPNSQVNPGRIIVDTGTGEILQSVKSTRDKTKWIWKSIGKDESAIKPGYGWRYRSYERKQPFPGTSPPVVEKKEEEPAPTNPNPKPKSGKDYTPLFPRE